MAVDVFAGCGGLTAGLKQAGFDVLAGIEIDATAQRVYQLNHPDALLLGDVTKLENADLLNELCLEPGELDLLAGCPPCQGFSTVRTLNGKLGITDPQNDLIFEFSRLVNALRPKAIMLENVPGLATDQRFADFIAKLESLKYQIKYSVLNAAEYGVPQRRRRLIMLAGQYGPIHFARRARIQLTVRDAISGLKPAGQSGDEAHDIPENRDLKTRRLISKIPKNGGSRSALSRWYRLECHKHCKGFKDIYGRMAWDAVAPTLTTGCYNPSKGRFLHPEENRAITIREAALLQTFPRRYQFPAEIGKERLSRLIGNALPPEFVKRHAKAVHRYLRTHSRAKTKK